MKPKAHKDSFIFLTGRTNHLWSFSATSYYTDNLRNNFNISNDCIHAKHLNTLNFEFFQVLAFHYVDIFAICSAYRRYKEIVSKAGHLNLDLTGEGCFFRLKTNQIWEETVKLLPNLPKRLFLVAWLIKNLASWRQADQNWASISLNNIRVVNEVSKR